MPVKELNCLGDMCPIPLMKLKECAELRAGGSVLLVTDHSCVCESVRSFCRQKRLRLTVAEPVPGVWEMRVEGGGC